MGRFTRVLAWVACLGFVAGCSSSSDDDDSVGSTSFSGTIRRPSGTGIQGVRARVQAPGIGGAFAEAVTDVDGNFIVLAPPTGFVNLQLAAENAVGGTFPDLELQILVGGGATDLSHPVVLPDLAAGATTSVAVDGSGMTIGATTLTAPNGAALDIADMTEILLDGAIPTMPVSLNITPVEPIHVPMPLPGSLDASSFVTVQPGNATFDPALGITLPNERNFPVGTMVDIYSFDHDEAAWVNRSLETGNQGVVEPTGMFIVASAVITEGGWHAGALPVDLDCATTIAGQVIPLGPPVPVPGVLISLSTGQFTTTDADGRFSLPFVPAYDASVLPTTCVGDGITLETLAPVSFGAGSSGINILSTDIVTGGVTNVPAFHIQVTNTGSLVGSVTENGQRVAGTVALAGTETLDVDSDANGTFFVASLDVGPYMATFPFTTGEVTESFDIVAHETTVLAMGARGSALEVHVLDFIEDEVGLPVEDACVTLVGAGSAPQFATSDVNGVASFPHAPAGPYDVTAQKDSAAPFGTHRLAVSLLGVNSASAPKVIVVPILETDLPDLVPVALDATLEGTISNGPAGGFGPFDYYIANDSVGFQDSNFASAAFGFDTSIPSNVPLDVVVTASNGTGILSAVLMTNVMAAPGQTLVLDFDFANAIEFDRTVAMQYTNPPASTFFTHLELSGVGTLSFPLVFGHGLPASIVLPDLSIAGLASLDAVLSIVAEGQKCSLQLGHITPTALQMDFLEIPTIQSPVGAVQSFGPGDSVQFTLGSGNGTTTGFNSVSIHHQNNNDLFFWDILVPANQTMVVLPAVHPSKPMVTGGFHLRAGSVRFDFPGLDFATFFDSNFPNNWAAVETLDICESEVDQLVAVVPP